MTGYKKCTLQFFTIDLIRGIILDQQWTSRISQWGRNLFAGRLLGSFSFSCQWQWRQNSGTDICSSYWHTSYGNTTSSQASSRSSRRVLATVRVFRADIMLDTGKHSNIHRYKLTVHVNSYREEDATIPYILEKVMESIDEKNLVLVGPNGLILYDKEGTRG